MVGNTLGHYEILAPLGVGGMGEVYRARDTKLGREVAVKLLRGKLSTDPDRLARFESEAKLLAALNHVNIATIYGLEDDGKHPHIVMELVEGSSFRELLSMGPLPGDRIIDLSFQITEGLARAHSAGIVHRDLKPENLMLNEDGFVKILDFGLAKLVPGGDTDFTTLGGGRTEPGIIMGTVGYMSPEQAYGRPVDHRADQFALGAIIYEMACGQRAFAEESPALTLAAIIQGEPEPLVSLQPGLPGELVALVETLLAKQPGERFDSTRDLATVLKAMRDGSRRGAAADGEIDADEAVTILEELGSGAGAPAFLGEESGEAAPVSELLFAGRDVELTQLEELLDKVLAGSGSIALVTGEAGHGKTALIDEFARQAQARHASLVVARGGCNAQIGRGEPYHPFREMLQWLVGDVEARWVAGALDRAHARRLWDLAPTSIEAILEQGPDLIETFLSGDRLVELAASMPPETRLWLADLRRLLRRKAAAMGPPGPSSTDLGGQFIRVVLHLARRRPLLLLLDDLHWVDAESASLLFRLARSVSVAPMFIIGAFRPSEIGGDPRGKRHPLESAVNEVKATFGDVEIRVGAAGGRDFVDAYLDTRPNRFSREFRAGLYRQTDGHPLFTIELMRALEDRGAIGEDDAGLWFDAVEIDWDLLPVRVEAVIGERLERLSSEQRQLLTVASVEGDSFTAEVAAAVLKAEAGETVHLLSGELGKGHQVVQADGLRRVDGRRLSTYSFRHILFQRYIYGRLDEVERAVRHEEVGCALEELHGEHADEVAVELARHFEAAGLYEKAASYLHCAGVQAARLFSNQQAIAYFDRALDLLEHLLDDDERLRRELEFQVARGSALIAHKGWGSDEVEATFTRARELCEEMGRPPQLYPTLWGLWLFNAVRMRLATARELSGELTVWAEQTDDSSLQLQAHHARWTTDLFAGDLDGARRACKRGLEIYRPELHHRSCAAYGNHDPGVCGLLFSSWGSALAGRVDEAVEIATRSLRLAESLDHPLTLGFGRLATTTARLLRREVEPTRNEAESLVAITTEHNLPLFLATGQVYLGWALAQVGELEQALALYELGWRGLAVTGSEVARCHAGALMAETYIAAGMQERAREVLTAAAGLIEAAGGHYYQAEVLRLRGLLDDDEPLIRKAAAIANRQGAYLLELRASRDLARRLADRGRGMEGKALAEAACGYFDAGTSIPDLDEARALLGD